MQLTLFWLHVYCQTLQARSKTTYKSSMRRCLVTLLTFFSLLLVQADVSLASNERDRDKECVHTSSNMTGKGLLEYIAHFWDQESAIQTPGLESGHELTQFTKGFPFKRFDNPGDRAPLKYTQSNHWFRFCLHNPSEDTHNLVAAFEPASLSEVDFYPQKPGLPSFKAGNTKSMSARDIPNSHFDFNIRLVAGETQRFYLRVNAEDNPFLHAQLWDKTSYYSQNNRDESRWGIFVGVFMGLVIYHLLLFFSARQSTSLLFIVWSTCIFIMLSSLDGRLVQYLLPDQPHFSQLGLNVFYPLSIFLSAALFNDFIKIKNYPTWNHIGKALLFVSGLILVTAYLNSPLAYAKALDAVAVVIACYFGLMVPIYTLFNYRLDVAKYIMFTLTPLIVVLVDRTLFSLEITSEYFVPYKLEVAAVCAMIIISYYIGLVAYREKQSAQHAAMEQLNISNTLKSNYNTQLEQELEQKTADIRLMNADLEQQASKLLQLDESKSKFFANISHEFRTPLTLIEGPLNNVLDSNRASDKIVLEKTTIENVVKHSNSLKGLIDQILLLSELDENSLDLRASQANVVQTLQGFSAQFDSVCRHKGIELTCQASHANIQAYVDTEKLHVIINNLLSNAIKFTESPGQITLDVTTTTTLAEPIGGYPRDEYVQITVSDTGQGIPEKELAHVFDRYFQSASSELSQSGIGTGIGLALVKELVELHAGSVTVESVYAPTEGSDLSGTSFKVTLPLGRAHLTDNEIIDDDVASESDYSTLLPAGGIGLLNSDSDNNESTADANIKGPIILVVDDNEDMRQHIKSILEPECKVITANDGLLAEQALNRQIPSLIITDLMMPNRNGLEFVESIKKQERFAQIPIIMLTARAGLHDRIKGLMAAVDDYLIKPFNGRELKARILNLLNKQAQFEAFYKSQQQSHNNNKLVQASSETKEQTFLDNVKAIVENHLNQVDFGVDELAKSMHMSEATLRRRLSENAKFTPAAFIRHCRLEKARQIATEGTARSVAELAQAVGFTHPVYFARLYEKTFNCKIEL